MRSTPERHPEGTKFARGRELPDGHLMTKAFMDAFVIGNTALLDRKKDLLCEAGA